MRIVTKRLRFRLGYICRHISQLHGLVTHMHGKKGVTNRFADDRTLDCGHISAEHFHWIRGLTVDICARIISVLIMLTTYDSISTWYNIDIR